MAGADRHWSQRLAFAVGLVIIVAGMVNVTPKLPGLPPVGDFPLHYYQPFMFGLFMLVVVLRGPFAAALAGRGLRWPGLLIDIAFLASVAAFILAYLDQKETVGFRLFGDAGPSAQAIHEDDDEIAAIMGLDRFGDEVERLDPHGPGTWVLVTFLSFVALSLVYNVKNWGMPAVAFTILMIAYAAGTYLVDQLGLAPGSVYWATKIANPALLMKELIINDVRGLLGQFMNVLLQTVFPYVVLGALFGSSAGGRSLIKLAVLWTRHLRGGPAHAAIASSAVFGTISGAPVVNVLSTGTLTIPMMARNGFSARFAGAVEATASSAGQIMPPVMGVAAFLLASLTSVGYVNVALAALVPALFCFAALFLTVVFESRKMRIAAVGAVSDDMRLTRQDYLNLTMILVPILVILFVLVVYANERSAGWWAAMVLLPLLFLDPEVRRAPGRILAALSNGGIQISQLFLLFLAVSLVDASLNVTGFPTAFSNSVLQIVGAARDFYLWGTHVVVPDGLYLFLTLIICMVASILLGMGMPTVPAYVNVALIMAPVLGALGTSFFTAHIFVFYFACVSAITPPVALAAFAAASVARADPLAIGVTAVRVGAVMFAIPFVFAFYPELLLIDGAFKAAAGAGTIPTRPDGFDPLTFVSILVRLPVSLYLLASALSRFDRMPFGYGEAGLRIALAVGLLFTTWLIALPAAILAALVVVRHHLAAARAGAGDMAAARQ